MKIYNFNIIYISKVFYTLNAMIVIRQLIGKRSDIKLYNQSRKTFYVSKGVFGVVVFYSLFNVALFIKSFCNSAVFYKKSYRFLFSCFRNSRTSVGAHLYFDSNFVSLVSVCVFFLNRTARSKSCSSIEFSAYCM